MSTTEQPTQPAPYATNYGAGKVHLGSGLGSRSSAYTVLFCTGRAVRGAFRTDEPVACKACLKRAAANGMEVEDQRVD